MSWNVSAKKWEFCGPMKAATGCRCCEESRNWKATCWRSRSKPNKKVPLGKRFRGARCWKCCVFQLARCRTPSDWKRTGWASCGGTWKGRKRAAVARQILREGGSLGTRWLWRWAVGCLEIVGSFECFRKWSSSWRSDWTKSCWPKWSWKVGWPSQGQRTSLWGTVSALQDRSFHMPLTQLEGSSLYVEKSGIEWLISECFMEF